MKNNVVEINKREAAAINGGGVLYDVYRIVVEEKDDFFNGLKAGFKNGFL